MSASQTAALRALLEQRFPGTTPVVHHTAGALATGIGPLDMAFPGGGLPRGRLVAWAPGGGATAALRSVCSAALQRGERAAWVDGAGVVCGAGWVEGVALFRAQTERTALECAEELVRSGGFSLAVLSGAGAAEVQRVRLVRAAREGGGTLVLLDEGGSMASVRVATRIRAADYRWRLDPFGAPAEVERVRVRAHVAAPGWSREAEFSLAVAPYELRLSVEPALADRRGAAAR